MEQALDFVRFLMLAPINKIAIENPIGCISTKIRKLDQIIQPYQFGHNNSKRTCLWLKNLPLLKPTKQVQPNAYYKACPRWKNQSKRGHDKTPYSKNRWKIRSRTFGGIALAMAQQYGKV